MNAMIPLCVTVLVCCVGVFAHHEFVEQLKESGCLEKVGLTKEELKDYKDDPESETGKKIDCMHACFLKHTKTMDEDGIIDVEAVHEKIEEYTEVPEEEKAAALEKLNECAEEAQKLEDSCKVAGEFVRCIFPHHKKE